MSSKERLDGQQTQTNKPQQQRSVCPLEIVAALDDYLQIYRKAALCFCEAAELPWHAQRWEMREGKGEAAELGKVVVTVQELGKLWKE